MEILNKSQAQERIRFIDGATVPYSVTNRKVAAVLHYLMERSIALGESCVSLETLLNALRTDFDGLNNSVGYPGGIAVLSDYGFIPKAHLSASVFCFDGFAECGKVELSGLFWGDPDGRIYFDASKKKFFLMTGTLVMPKYYISWGSNHEFDIPSSNELGPNESSLYICNDELYIWTGERMRRVTRVSGNMVYENSELQTLRDVDIVAPLAGQALIYDGRKWVNRDVERGEEIIDTGPYNNTRPYRFKARSQDGRSLFTEDCWHCGCRWRCNTDGVCGVAPGYGVGQWDFVSGNPAFTIDFQERQICYTEEEIQSFGAALTLTARMYNQDVLSFIKPYNIEWRRESYDSNGALRSASDAAWQPRTDKDNKRLLLDFRDLDYDGTSISKITFICTAFLDDEKEAKVILNIS